MIRAPTCIYINWAAYDELSDSIELTESLALAQLEEFPRLRAAGMRLDYYLMDAFWYSETGGYRQWRTPHWPAGPARFLARCRELGVKPGLWLSGNVLAKLKPAPAWRDSLNRGGTAMAMFAGGFLPDLLAVMHHWYEAGVRLYKFDFMNFQAVPALLEDQLLPSEVRARNVAALRDGLRAFRQTHPEVVLLGYNGFEEAPQYWTGSCYKTHPGQGGTGAGLMRVCDAAWLEVFDSLYCGDPRPADVPAMNFWRSKDIYSDQMTRLYEHSGFPLARIDNAGFMVGLTGTCYKRGTAAWQGMLLLSLARGGWINTYYGNLELLDAARAAWFAQAQRLYLPLQEYGRICAFGGLPGAGEPYGWLGQSPAGQVWTVVNPGQSVTTLELPLALTAGSPRLLFADPGFGPSLSGTSVTLGPEQLAVFGAGSFAAPEWELGLGVDYPIPHRTERLPISFSEAGAQTLEATLPAPSSGRVRVILRQWDPGGLPKRSVRRLVPGGETLAAVLRLEARQGERRLPLAINYDKAIWSGLSWAVGEVAASDCQAGQPLTLRLSSTEAGPLRLTGEAYLVQD